MFEIFRRHALYMPNIWLRNAKYIGTSVRRSSRLACGRSSGNDISDHYKQHYRQAQPKPSLAEAEIALISSKTPPTPPQEK